ncbi:IS5 family transposase [Azospirillum formosense]|uniref:IS5 family transposase n=1 Tax=Azospirillum formosense TaxID=861533 RepID=UPI001C92B311|nr:IS5 family transposase [Azospirillum formosense]MBY3757484.1 IS5 family transposase [Azospirillum formosense]
MARRRIGQEEFRFPAEEGRRGSALDEASALLDWSGIDRLLAPIYAAEKGERAWPPLALFKALLLAVWYDLSDVKLAEAVDDRASVRRFCGFAATEATPERTAFVRFRRELVKRGLDRVLFDAVGDQLAARGVVVRTGTLIDATVIASASVSDPEAQWVGHRRKAPVHGFKAHVAADGEGGIVRAIEVAPANVHDGKMLGSVLPQEPGDVYADLAYVGDANRQHILAAGGRPFLPARGTWGGEAALRRLETWNRQVGRIRRRVEKIFGTWKRSYGLRLARYRGLARFGLQVRLTAIAYNLRRAATILKPVPA